MARGFQIYFQMWLASRKELPTSVLQGIVHKWRNKKRDDGWGCKKMFKIAWCHLWATPILKCGDIAKLNNRWYPKLHSEKFDNTKNIAKELKAKQCSMKVGLKHCQLQEVHNSFFVR
jgi:hypothetical protein